MPPEDKDIIASRSQDWLLGFRCLATDPAVPWWWLEVEDDPSLQKQMIAVHLETTANAYRALADGAAKAAGIAAAAAKNRG
jgi:hypothetical protein